MIMNDYMRVKVRKRENIKSIEALVDDYYWQLGTFQWMNPYEAIGSKNK